ncbi:MAG: hypothetical protein LAT55_07730 [Opitutales bacterium]|nr:hypothetical protein [Opitutales bacterium]
MTFSIPSLPDFVLFIALFFAPAETSEIHLEIAEEKYLLTANESHWTLQPGEERIARQDHLLTRDDQDHDLRGFKKLLQEHDWEEEPKLSLEDGALVIEVHPSPKVVISFTIEMKGVENRGPFVYTITFDPEAPYPDKLSIHLTQETLTVNGETLSGDSLRTLLEKGKEPLVLMVVIESDVPFGQARELLQAAQENNHRIVFRSSQAAP